MGETVNLENQLLNNHLKIESERLNRVMEASNTGIWEWNIKTNEVYYSPRWKELLGYSDDELPNEFATWQNNLHPDDAERMVKNVGEFLQNPVGNFEHKFRMKHKNGSYVWILNRSAVTLDEKGKPEYMSGSHLDITGQVVQEENLIKSEKRFRNIFENSPLGKSLTGIDGSLKVNKRFTEITGYTEEEINHKHWKEITHPDDIAGSEKAIQEMLNSTHIVNFRKRYIHKKGHTVWTDVRSVAYRDEEGKPIHFLTSIAEINDLVEAEKQLKESETKFRSLFQNLTIPLCNVDGEGNMALINNQFTKTFGYTLDDIPTLDDWWMKAYPDESYRQWVLKTWNQAVENAQNNNVEIRSEEYLVTCKNGEIRTVTIGGFALENGFLATFIDVTERKIYEDEIKKAKEYAETIIKTANAILVVLDHNGNVQTLNEAGEKIVGHSIENIRGKNWFETIVPRKLYPDVWNEFERISKGGIPKYFENPILTKNGTERIISWQNSQLFENNEVSGIVSFGTDITERKLAEEQLQIAIEQLKNSNKELEQFAYVASHDLQEPLRKVKNYVELYENRYGNEFDERAKKYLNTITNGVSRMQVLIDDLLTLSRVSTRGRDLVPVDLNEVLTEVLDVYELKINEKNALIAIQELPVIRADKQQLIQLFQNLISNALKYCDKNPEISIDLKSEKNNWIIQVSDNGIGFDNKYNEKIFVVFQRLHTRDEYSGTGIGLAVCKKIAERHGGSISAVSEPGKGSVFSIRFPKLKKSK